MNTILAPTKIVTKGPIKWKILTGGRALALGALQYARHERTLIVKISTVFIIRMFKVITRQIRKEL